MKKKIKRQGSKVMLIIIQFVMFNFLMYSVGYTEKQIIMGFEIYILLALANNIYSFKTHTLGQELKDQLRQHFEIIGILLFIEIFNKGFGNFIPVFFAMVFFFLINMLAFQLIRVIFRKNLLKNLVIVGTGETAKEITNVILNNRSTMYEILGYIDARELIKKYTGRRSSDKKLMKEKSMFSGRRKLDREITLEIDPKKIIGIYKNIEKIIENNQIDEMIIAIPNINQKVLQEIIKVIEGKIKIVKFIPEINNTYTFNSRVEDYDGTLLVASTSGGISPFEMKVKRFIDIIAGLVGISILGVLNLVYSRKIKADGGTLLFSHTRIGENLNNFKMYKFRSMYIDAEERLKKMLAEDEEVRKEFYTNFKLKNDPRITSIGKFLRKTSLDEFPQFINVLKGEMSLVGPRPIVQKEIDIYYGDEVGKKVFKVKPGLTGMWQSHGRSDIENYDKRIAMDLYYIRNWSLWLDIVILIKTIKNVVQKKGAY